MYKTYYYEDLFLQDTNLRHKILEEVIKYDAIEIKCLSSKERNLVYKEMYLPLGFEKVKENEHVHIVVYNRLKKKNENENKNENESSYDSDSDYSCSDTNIDTDTDTDTDSESVDSSYVTEEMEKLDMLENMNAKQLQHLENIDKNVNYLCKIVNTTLFGIVSGTIYLIYLLQPPPVNYHRICLPNP
jgi:hypothetical protein